MRSILDRSQEPSVGSQGSSVQCPWSPRNWGAAVQSAGIADQETGNIPSTKKDGQRSREAMPGGAGCLIQPFLSRGGAVSCVQ